MDARSFLKSVSGFVDGTRTERINRLATIDPSYTSGAPKVTFDGESTLTTKGYKCAAYYTPVPSDRVLMLPVGGTYVITGKVGDPSFPMQGSLSLGTVDLDTVVATGAYYQGTSADATAVRHYPLVHAGLLEVAAYGGSFVQQRYTQYMLSGATGSRVFVRGKYGASWGAWREQATVEPWTAFTPVPTPTTGAFSGGVTAVGRYSVVGKTVDFNFAVTLTSLGSGSGYLLLTLPVAANSTVLSVGHGREDAATGASFSCQITDANHIGCQTYNNGVTVVAGYHMVGSIRYEAI